MNHSKVIPGKHVSDIEGLVTELRQLSLEHPSLADTLAKVEATLSQLSSENKGLTAQIETSIENRKRMHNAQRISKIGTWYWEPDSGKVAWSEEMYHIFGIEPGTEINTDIAINSFHPDDRDKIKSLTELALQTGKPQIVESRVLLPNGEIRHVFGIGEAVLSKDGKLLRMAGIYQDVTHWKLIEERLYKTEQFYESLTRNAPDGVVLISPESQFKYVSPSARRMFGYTDTEDINHSPMELTHPDDVQWVVSELNKLIKNPEYMPTLQYHFLHKDGGWRWIESTFRNLFYDPAINGIVINFRDITDRKLAETQLIESEEKYRTLLDTMNEAVVVVDNNDVMQYVNPALCAMYGYTSDEMIGKYGYQYLIHKEDQHVILEKNQQRVKGVADTYEVRGVKSSGEIMYIHVSGAPLKDKTGEIIGSVGIMTDITESKSLREQLLASQKMDAIAQLAGGIAHDFNNLLAVILGYAEGISTSLPKTNPLRKDAEEIIKAGEQASNLTRQLLTFSRKQVVQPRVLDLNEKINSLSDILQRLVGHKIRIQTKLSTQPLKLKFDPGQLDQVIINLTMNASEAMPDGGTLTVESSDIDITNDYIATHVKLTPGKYVMLAISDTGIGMEKDIQRRIFEPFFTTKGKGRGLGLGLSTVYGIIQQADGAVTVYSELGQGTKVKILVPAIIEEQQVTKPKAILLSEHSGNGELVMVVDDEMPLCQLLKKILEKLNYSPQVYSDSLEALQAFKDGMRPALLITDVVMPSLNGKQLADEVCKINPSQEILFMSGYTDNAIVHNGVLRQDFPFVQKPFSSKDIGAMIKKILSKPKSSSLSSAMILLLDDDESIRRLFQRACSRRGHICIGTATLEEALNALKETKFDMILIDLNLIGMSGFYALSQIRNSGINTPAIMVTGSSDTEIGKEHTDLNIVKVIEKSFDDLPLLRFIEAHLGIAGKD